MRRIICIGNRLQLADAAGPRVHDRLAALGLPPGVELVDGGLAGLDLARFVRDAEGVVFVDSIAGFAREPGREEVILLSAQEVAAESTSRFDHSAGLPYLLRALPAVLEGPPPPIAIVGVEGEPGPELVERAAHAALGLVAGVSSCGGLS